MGTLSAALQWAQRGFRVFPLAENSREPAIAGVDWTELASSDPALIRQLWVDPVLNTERNYNIGCDCTDMVVIDIDVKKGKDGYNKYLGLGGNFDTLVVRTPSGGFHCYFRGPDSGNAPLDKDGVDVRSHRGYVVAPGSSIDGNAYQVINDVPMAWVPAPIEPLLGPVYVRRETDETAIERDNTANVEAAKRYLETVAPAIEGQRGDEQTFKVAARLVRELALAQDTAFVLMRDIYNPRCVPPWGIDELYLKVENAFAYGSADVGAMSPDVQFARVQVTPPPSVFEQSPAMSWGNAVTPSAIRPRPWLVDRFLMEGAITLLMAAGSAGKSSISLALAAHLALGLDFAGYKAKRPCKSIIYNGEDDIEEQSRRLIAVCMLYGFDYAAVKERILLLSSRELKLDLVSKQGYNLNRNDVIVNQLTELCKDPDVGMLVLDPLVKIHKVDENNNVEMDYVMETLTDMARNASIAVLVLHHTVKGSKQEERIGNADIGRGGTAVVNAARIAFTLLNASQTDAEDYGLQDNERHMWVRLDDAKMNLALASGEATWFHKEGIKIVSNDVVGVLKHQRLERSRSHIRLRIAQLLIDAMVQMGQGSLPLAQAVAVAKTNEPLLANKTDNEVRKSIEDMFKVDCDVKGRKVAAIREPDGKNVHIVMR